MFCAHCREEITGKPIMQSGEKYCSLECANLASGIDPEEAEEYYEEEPVENHNQDDD